MANVHVGLWLCSSQTSASVTRVASNIPVSNVMTLVTRCFRYSVCASGAGTNLKVGQYVLGDAPEKFFRAPALFLALQIQLVVLVSAFVMVSTVWPVSSFLFAVLILTVLPCPAICKNALVPILFKNYIYKFYSLLLSHGGGHVPPHAVCWRCHSATQCCG